jgi:AraC-like DNA-binding protein
LKPAATLGEFLAAPEGRYFRGRRFITYAWSPTLIGYTTWGRPDADDCRQLLKSCEIGIRPDCERHRFLVDVRSLELIDPITFGLFLDYTRTHREILAQKIIRQAQLRPDGVIGAIIAGFSQLARLPYPEKVFGDAEAALEWLGVERLEGIDLLAEITALRTDAFDAYPIVGRLRLQLDAAGPVPIAEGARRLGLSTRSLQRELRNAGTTYREELTSFRIRRGQELLGSSDRNLEWIAAEVGFSSLQHFATAFRRATGATPTAWRARTKTPAV